MSKPDLVIRFTLCEIKLSNLNMERKNIFHWWTYVRKYYKVAVATLFIKTLKMSIRHFDRLLFSYNYTLFNVELELDIKSLCFSNEQSHKHFGIWQNLH